MPQKKRKNQKRKPSTKKGKAVKRLRRLNPFLLAIADPCDHGQEARIPDGQLFPTATAQIQFRATYATDANGNFGIAFYPCDAFVNITGTATTGLIQTATLNASAVVTGITALSQASYAAIPGLATQWALMSEGRVVSACMDCEYMGTTAADNGILVAGELVGDQKIATASGPAAFTSFDALSGLVKQCRTIPVRNGVRIKFYPAEQADLLMVDAITSASGTPTYGIGATGGSKSSLVLFARGCAASTSLFSILFTINLEYTPIAGAGSVPRQVGSDQPSWISSAARYVSQVANVVQELRGLVPLVGATVMAASNVGNSVGGLLGW